VPFIVGQVDDDGVFLGASEFRRVIVGIAEDWMKERLPAHCTTMVVPVVQLTSNVSGETPERYANVRYMARRYTSVGFISNSIARSV
jgi:hypothetical protein